MTVYINYTILKCGITSTYNMFRGIYVKDIYCITLAGNHQLKNSLCSLCIVVKNSL